MDVIVTKLHLLPSIVADEFLSADIPLGIDGSRGRTSNDVAILATGSLVDSDSSFRLEFVKSDVTSIADILRNRITGYKRTYRGKNQKYLFHIDY